jgi:hypothetical protein
MSITTTITILLILGPALLILSPLLYLLSKKLNKLADRQDNKEYMEKQGRSKVKRI